MSISQRFGGACLTAALIIAGTARAQGPGFYPAAVGTNGIVTVDSHNTYYDGSDGTLSAAIPLPAGATKLQFRVTGGVITDSSVILASADGLYADGRTPYNSTARFSGTYHGTPVGSSTGIDPALFGVFFNPGFTGTPADSLNYRSDSGIVPDPRRLPTYSPSVNQPFAIGDGYDANNPFVTTNDSYVPSGTNQTFLIPAGATQILLGIGADVLLGDNQNGSTTTAFQVHVFSDVPSTQAARFAFSTQPSGGLAGQPLTTQPVVQALMGNGTLATGYNGPVTLLVKTGTGSTGANVGNATVSAVNGVATFTSVTIDRPGAGYVLTATGGGVGAADSLPFDIGGSDHGTGFHVSAIGTNGVLTVDSHNTIYDGSNGTLFQKVALPPGATQMQFRVTGGVITDSSATLASPDGLYPDGRTPYNFTDTKWAGTYQGTPVGRTTGIDPALFGVFFDPGFTGTPADSLNYRSDSGIVPDPRTASVFTPTGNQPFWIGDGYTVNNPFVTSDDSFIPGGTIQTFTIPTGATYIVLGIAADIDLGDNQNGATTTAFRVHAFDNSATQPAAALSFLVQPIGGQPGAPLAVQPQVTALDATGHRAFGYNGPVTVAIQAGTGASGAALGGTTTVNAIDGIATFTNLSISKAGVGYALVATASGLPPATSLRFHVPGSLLFIAGRDFTAASNPSGAWRYGYETTRGAAFNTFPQHSQAVSGLDVWNTATIPSLGVYHNGTSAPITSSDMAIAPGMMVLHPGPNGQNAVVRWTAPASGTYLIKARFLSVSSGATTDVAVMKNGGEMFSDYINVNGRGPSTQFTGTQALAAGDTVDFNVGYGNGNYNSDSTALNALIVTLPDLDGNAAFDALDVRKALRIAGGLDTATPAQMSAGDLVPGNGLSIADAVTLLRIQVY